MEGNRNRPTCPQCGSKKVARLQWGRPIWGERLEKELNSGETELAGCFIDKYSERWVCRECRTRFGNIDLGWLIEKKKRPDYVEAHLHSYRNEKEIKASTLCACFHCEQFFVPQQIEAWLTESNGELTALCPYCGLDSVIGDAAGYELTALFVQKMHDYWFEVMVRHEE